MIRRSILLAGALALPLLLGAQQTPLAPLTPLPPAPAKAPLDPWAVELRSDKLADRPAKAFDKSFEKAAGQAFEKTAEKFAEKRLDLAWSGQQPAMPAWHGGDAWYQGDPADSAYRAAYSYFGRQEYRSAADRFNDVRGKFPSSRYFCDAAYYEAFARYRLGTPNDLRTASRVLDGMGSRCADGARRQDVPELAARIDGVLARLGDNDAAERVRRAASQGQSVCDREERNVKIQALSALAQMDPDGAKPILGTVLALRDDCSAPVRREALQLVARTSDAGSIALLAKSARTDPDYETQIAAADALARIGTDASYAAIEDILRTSNDERVQVAAARALGQSDSPRAQSSVRALAERKDVAERIRVSVINSLGSRGGITTDYWRSLYGKVESDELRRAIVGAVNRNDDAGVQFLIGIAGNGSEPSSVRQYAISRVQQIAPVADLYRLLETADSRAVRMSIVSAIGGRKEPETTDRLIQIAKRGTDPEVRAAAIRLLGQPARRDDPKVRQALADILASQS